MKKEYCSSITILIAAAAAVLCGFTQASYGVVVQTTNRIINNGSADFGSGTHASGGPTGSATITYDWNTSTGQLRSTGRVRGTLYWDALISGGCSRLTIRFQNTANGDLATRIIDECGPGGNANDSANKTTVDEGFASTALSHIVLTTAEVPNVNPTSITITQVVQRVYPVTIQNGVADFGDGFHAFGFPQEPGHVTFRRNIALASVFGIVDGILYYDSSNSNSCSRLIIERRNSNGTVVNTQPFLNCGPGRDANAGANQLDLNNNSLGFGSLADIRLRVADTAFLINEQINTYGFAGLVGDFEVEPADAVADVHEAINYGFIWSVPEPLNWHDLDTLELRIRDGETTIMQMRFDESGNLLSLLNQQTGVYGKASAFGSNKKLQNQFVTLDLAESTVGAVNNAIGVGPNSPTVRLGLDLTFKPSARGRRYSVEVAATDDAGNVDPFAFAGTIVVP